MMNAATALLHDLRGIRPTPTMFVLAGLAVIGLVTALIRFAFGIGAISNLTNAYSWGLWISLDLLCGVALGAGAFTIAAAVYILNLKQFQPILRPAILTGFLGYLMVIVALMVDLGRPERIWHMMIYQNGHSVLFEVGLCVMLYTTVLALEFLPVLLKRTPWHRPIHLLHAATMPLVILGVVLSTLHQSSLGSLFLIMPSKLHPIWYTPLLPLFFFLSAVTVGLAMVIIEASLSARAFRRPLELRLLSQLARAIPYLLGVYLIVRLADLAVAGELALTVQPTQFALLFWVELLIGWVAPLLLLANARLRQQPKWMLAGAGLVVLGVVINRFNVSLLALGHLTDQPYFPSIGEFAISLGIISAGVLAFALVARLFPLFEAESPGAQETISPATSGSPAG
jgi:Ni/Fe-hydrogenase subunit HybB-like protein